mmetsp:Transcript_21487/g.54083  ORF Transcript_21487/g.54083 Transcript_21487/m.54083 type:complete len:209 (-) Transcript_21487:1624-2250(-)
MRSRCSCRRLSRSAALSAANSSRRRWLVEEGPPPPGAAPAAPAAEPVEEVQPVIHLQPSATISSQLRVRFSSAISVRSSSQSCCSLHSRSVTGPKLAPDSSRSSSSLERKGLGEARPWPLAVERSGVRSSSSLSSSSPKRPLFSVSGYSPSPKWSETRCELSRKMTNGGSCSGSCAALRASCISVATRKHVPAGALTSNFPTPGICAK